jgi:hypothetical protein
MTALRTGRLAALVALISLFGAACGSAATTPVPTTDCQHWCGTASASVTFAGQTATISGGGCYDQGSEGIDVRIGDWQGEGVGDYVQLSGYRPGGPTPGPTATSSDGSGDAGASPQAAGNVGGTPFTSFDAVVTFTSDQGGTFSGTDVNGLGPVSGTFTCR